MHLQGATASVVALYKTMAASPEFLKPLSWSSPDFSLEPYNLVFLPGGHEKGVRQLIDSPIMARHLASYFPQTLKPSSKSVAAVCHGVMVLANAKLPADAGEHAGKSVIHACATTALPAKFEQTAYWGTRAFLGDYYKTYGAGSEDVEESVSKVLDDPEKQWKGSIGMRPWVIEDDKYNYISARFPGDVETMAERVVAQVRGGIE